MKLDNLGENMSSYSKLTVADLRANVVDDIVANFDEIDYYFGNDGKHEFWMRWKHLLPQTTICGKLPDAAEFLELEGKAFLLPIPRQFHGFLTFKSAFFTSDGSRVTLFFAIDEGQGPINLGVYFTGAVAVADRYEKDGISFYLGRYLHQSYLVGNEKGNPPRN